MAVCTRNGTKILYREAPSRCCTGVAGIGLYVGDNQRLRRYHYRTRDHSLNEQADLVACGHVGRRARIRDLISAGYRLRGDRAEGVGDVLAFSAASGVASVPSIFVDGDPVIATVKALHPWPADEG